MDNSTQENLTTEPSRMKIFQMAQENLATVGVSPDLSHQSYPFNRKIFLSFLILSSYITCNLAYTLFVAKSFTEYTQAIYMDSFIALVTLEIAIIVFNVEQLFLFFNDCENLINTSERMKSI